MSEIICYVPTYSPDTESDTSFARPYTRLTNEQILDRIGDKGRLKPWMYMDVIDSILNIRPDIKLVIGDGRSSDSIRSDLKHHHLENDGKYDIVLYPEKESQWIIFNDILKIYSTPETKYFIYSSSDVIWHMDWVQEAIKEFERNPKLQILFPCVNSGDPNLPCQISASVRDLDPIAPPFQEAAQAPVLNAYAMIFRIDFLRTYGGYPNIFRNCFSESFLHYMCEAMGGEMKIMPRGHVFHYGEGDKWQNEKGSPYYYTEEKFKFQDIMNKALMAKAMRTLNVNFLKKILYK